MKNTPSKVTYIKTEKKRNMWVFDAGLHTQHMKMKPGERDVDFVQRFLVKFFDGCRNRGGTKYKDYFMWHKEGMNYITVWGVE